VEEDSPLSLNLPQPSGETKLPVTFLFKGFQSLIVTLSLDKECTSGTHCSRVIQEVETEKSDSPYHEKEDSKKNLSLVDKKEPRCQPSCIARDSREAF